MRLEDISPISLEPRGVKRGRGANRAVIAVGELKGFSKEWQAQATRGKVVGVEVFARVREKGKS